MKFPCNQNDRKAFTLLELIVVIVILGVLAALAIPTFRQVIEESSFKTLEASAQSLEREAVALAAFQSEASSGAESTQTGSMTYLETAYQDFSSSSLSLTKASTTQYALDDGARSVCLNLSTLPGATGTVSRGDCTVIPQEPVGDPVSEAGRAVWVWESTATLTSFGNSVQTLTDWAVSQNIDSVFLHRGWNPDELDKAYSGELSAALHARGIDLYAVGAGDSGWWDEGSTNAVIWSDRQLSTGHFDGIHLDIEPWADGTSVPELVNYMAALEGVKASTTAAGVTLGVATNPQLVSYSDANGTFLEQVTNLADSTVIMGFRDTSPALLERTSEALAYAEAAGKPIRFGVSMEPVEVVENCSHCTFVNDGLNSFLRVEAEVSASLITSPWYEGLAVQSYGYWILLPLN